MFTDSRRCASRYGSVETSEGTCKSGSSIGRSERSHRGWMTCRGRIKNFETYNVLLLNCFEELQHAAKQELELQSFCPTSPMDLFTIGNDFLDGRIAVRHFTRKGKHYDVLLVFRCSWKRCWQEWKSRREIVLNARNCHNFRAERTVCTRWSWRRTTSKPTIGRWCCHSSCGYCKNNLFVDGQGMSILSQKCGGSVLFSAHQ